MIDEKTIDEKTIAERIKEVRKKTGLCQRDFAIKADIGKSSANYYESASRVPGVDVLQKICKTYDVSCDWLLGLTNTQKPDADLRAVCEYTGLSEKAVEVLHAEKAHDNPTYTCNNDFLNQFIEYLFSNENPFEFFSILVSIRSLLERELRIDEDGTVMLLDDNNIFSDITVLTNLIDDIEIVRLNRFNLFEDIQYFIDRYIEKRFEWSNLKMNDLTRIQGCVTDIYKKEIARISNEESKE